MCFLTRIDLGSVLPSPHALLMNAYRQQEGFLNFCPSAVLYLLMFFQSTLGAEDGGISNKATRNPFPKSFEEEITCTASPKWYPLKEAGALQGSKEIGENVFQRRQQRVFCIRAKRVFPHNLSNKVKTIGQLFVDVTSAFRDLSSKS